MQNKTVRLEDVAQKAGVSITTVSHVINKTRYVKRETRELVLKVLDELHYDIRKPKTRRNGSRLIGVVVADITEDYYISVVKAIETYASEQAYSILLCDSEDDVEKEKYNLKNILDKDVAGLIIAPVNSQKCPRELSDADLPVVFVDRKYDRHQRVFVGINNFESGYVGTEYLASKGCRAIGFIGYPESVYTVHQRSIGYRDFLLQRLPECPPRTLTVNYRQEDSTALIREFVESARPDGLLCATSDVCYQLLGSLGELDIRIPEQIKIVTYDDNKWLDYLKFPISVITQPTTEIGFTAIDVLVRMILHPAERRKIATEIFLQTGFIDRL
ncbi:MAG TPA: LacI family DNA-binding transcriptional regulator [Spirochaetia bacterium]|nr:LacI family DNA-binding transcriptional regulator [Spirochaetia bacterium]